MNRTKAWISAFIVLVIGLHALPVLSYQGLRQTRWPFLTWAMYAKSYPPGVVQTWRRKLVAVAANGKQEEIDPYAVGLSKATFRNLYIDPIYNGDTTVALELLNRLGRNQKQSYVELRTQGIKYTVTDRGLVTEPFPVVTFRAPK